MKQLFTLCIILIIITFALSETQETNDAQSILQYEGVQAIAYIIPIIVGVCFLISVCCTILIPVTIILIVGLTPVLIFLGLRKKQPPNSGTPTDYKVMDVNNSGGSNNQGGNQVVDPNNQLQQVQVDPNQQMNQQPIMQQPMMQQPMNQNMIQQPMDQNMIQQPMDQNMMQQPIQQVMDQQQQLYPQQ